MPSISDTLYSIICQAKALRQMVDEGDDLEDERANLDYIDRRLDEILKG